MVPTARNKTTATFFPARFVENIFAFMTVQRLIKNFRAYHATAAAKSFFQLLHRVK